MLECLLLWVKFSPVATISAGLFYVILILSFLRRTAFQRFVSLPSPSTNTQIPALDSMRGIAASIVVLAHCWNFCYPIFNATQLKWWRFLAVGGNKCVPIFVVLSGFLIYRSVAKINSTDDLSRYIKRRFFRIYPVYFFTVLLGFLIGQKVFSIPNFLSEVFMVRILDMNIRFTNPPAWSLFVEVLFYILLPIWVALFRKRILLAATFSFIIFLLIDSLGARELWLWKYFFIGIIAQELSEYLKEHLSEKRAIVLFVIGLVLILMDFKVTRKGTTPYDWFNYLRIIPKNQAEYTIGLGVACLFLLIGLKHSFWISKILGNQLLRMVGTISYSLYLIHPFFIWAVFPKMQFVLAGTVQNLLDTTTSAPAWYLPLFMFPGCLAWALACFLLVERPFLLFSSRILGEAKKKQMPTLSPATN